MPAGSRSLRTTCGRNGCGSGFGSRPRRIHCSLRERDRGRQQRHWQDAHCSRSAAQCQNVAIAKLMLIAEEEAHRLDHVRVLPEACRRPRLLDSRITTLGGRRQSKSSACLCPPAEDYAVPMFDLGRTLLAAVERSPDVTAIADGKRRLSYVSWYEEIGRVAGGLTVLGLKLGDRLAVILQNRLEMASLHWACQFAGAAQLAHQARGAGLLPRRCRRRRDRLRRCRGGHRRQGGGRPAAAADRNRPD